MKVLIVMVLSSMMWSTLACDFSNPHSMSCQKQTFEGGIFPLSAMNPQAIDLNWVPSQFTPVHPNQPIVFRTLKSRSVRHRTCGVINPSGRRMGNLNIQFHRGQVDSVSIFGFLNRNFITDRRPRFEDAFTFVFGNDRGRNVFRCRIFDRVNIPHLTCQYYRDNRFAGYLGFLPHAESCD